MNRLRAPLPLKIVLSAAGHAIKINLQRLLKPRNPKIAEVKVEDVVDNRIMRKLEESGFIDRAFAAQGASFK